ncbi:MAG: hypothetical protein PV344_09020 [Anaplasma sp.]|nr:hypothetical protein [Anaplasma sp.]
MTSRENFKQHDAHVKTDVTRGMKGRRMSHMISLYKVIHLPQKKKL